ncbi:MAG: hypothetical protein NVS9B4_20900 [Candidatus Acidiferrum sp.]
MHALVNSPLPAHDEKTDAVKLYSEEIVTVQPNGKMKALERAAYKILRPGGKAYGLVKISFDSETRITAMHGWCVPAQGKDFEVKEKDATEESYFGDVVTDMRRKLLQIPAAEVGNIVGYEVEHEMRPYVFEDEWEFQGSVPAREARYTLQLPPGWEYKAVWLNHPEVAPTVVGGNQWQWVVNDVGAIKWEEDMPPRAGVSGRMILALIPAGQTGPLGGFTNWAAMGSWYQELTKGRRDAPASVKQEVATLTASSATAVAKMKALAAFLQHDIRYVAIELGIGGFQPHAAADVFSHRYGDCKDKATLLSSMLHEIGIESYYVIINTKRGGVTVGVPPHLGAFNHAILAIRLPDDVKDPSLVALIQHPKLGRLLIFDPTDELTPFGELRGPLQANYGLLITPEGGELTPLPQLPTSMNGIRRTAKLILSHQGVLRGDVQEVLVGDRAGVQREMLRTVTKDVDRIKPIEALLAGSLGTFQVTNASVGNLKSTDKPFVWKYSLVAEDYAKTAGNLLLVRPRVMGSNTSSLLETKDPRKFPVEFEGPSRDTDMFEIALPAGFVVDDLPPPVDVDYGFASYHSKTETTGNTLKYARVFEVKELSVPLNKVQDLKQLYRIIASDERNTAVLKPVGN